MGRNKFKVCGMCGKIENSNWLKHWKIKHDEIEEPYELKDGNIPNEPLVKWQANLLRDEKLMARYPKTI